MEHTSEPAGQVTAADPAPVVVTAPPTQPADASAVALTDAVRGLAGLVAQLPVADLSRLIEEGRQASRARSQNPPQFGTSLNVESPEDRQARLETQRAAVRRRRQVNMAAWSRQLPARWVEERIDFDTDDSTGAIRRWMANPRGNLILHGQDTGTGKSRAACLIGTYLVHQQGKWVIRHSAPMLNERLNPKGDPQTLEDALTCDVLIIDELGSERTSEWTAERLALVIGTRWENALPMIITTNLQWHNDDPTVPTIVSRYDDRICERLADEATAVHYAGESRRNPFGGNA